MYVGIILWSNIINNDKTIKGIDAKCIYTNCSY